MARIAVKVGTSTLTHQNATLNLRQMERLVRVLSDLKSAGHEIILISSGAISVGVQKLRLPGRPDELPVKQAAAAVGQCQLMHLYDKFFSEYSITVGQILLTRGDVEEPAIKETLLNTLHAMVALGVIPVINENDSVSHEEIESTDNIFGDNDTLSAIVADMCEADVLVLLSDIDGLFERDPREDPTARMLEEVRELTDEIRQGAMGAGTWRGSGGMITKLQAAEICMTAGIDMIITNGERPEDLYEIAEGKKIGTRFFGKQED